MKICPRFVASRFSRRADEYGEISSIQTEVASELLNKLDVPANSRVLDVGCGTGLLLAEIVKRNDSATGFGIDSASGMARLSRERFQDLHWLQADASYLPFGAWTFDSVVSSSCYQWVTDLPRAFKEVKRVLKKDGRFNAVLFGQGTLCELFDGFERAALLSGRLNTFEMGRLPSEKDVRRAFASADFRHGGVAAETRTVIFPNVMAILRWLHSIGANNLSQNFFLGRRFLAEAQIAYEDNYAEQGGLKASFEIIWVDAIK